MSNILVFFHCKANTGYAIGRLERVFFEMARRVAGSEAGVHFAYPDLGDRHPEPLPTDFRNLLRFDPTLRDAGHLRAIEDYVRQHGIEIAFGFDQPLRRPGYSPLRRAGVRTLVSYWGAPMSGLNHGLKLAVRRLEVALNRSGPDHYVFESKAMQRTAVEGRGIPATRTSVTYLGVDPAAFQPAATEEARRYAHDAFQIPHDRRIIYYSGHMEPRKGVHVIVRAAVELVDHRGVRDVHFLLLGNQPGEAERFADLYRGTTAADHITFGGYRRDVQRLIPGAYAGTIASTGWDSFTMSSLEMASSGVPLVVSKLPGLDETVEENETGFTFPVGDHLALASRLQQLLADPAKRDRMSAASRRRVLEKFTVDHQVTSLVTTIERAHARAR